MKSLLPQQQVHVRRWAGLEFQFCLKSLEPGVDNAGTAAKCFSDPTEAQFEPSCTYVEFFPHMSELAAKSSVNAILLPLKTPSKPLACILEQAKATANYDIGTSQLSGVGRFSSSKMILGYLDIFGPLTSGFPPCSFWATSGGPMGVCPGFALRVTEWRWRTAVLSVVCWIRK